MNCMKCGKKTNDEQVFCPACLTAMDAYPVKPDVRVQLPNREKRAASKKASRKRYTVSAEEQVAQLRKKLRRTVGFCVLLAVLLCAAGALLVQHHLAPTEKDEDLGTNYTYDSIVD